MEKYRTRAPNFSKFESEMLIDLVEKYKYIIENKKTDGVSLKEKDATWLKISEEFSRLPGVAQRTHINLKTAYENLKRKARRDAANEKLELYKTGGGIGGPTKLDGTGERILNIIKPTVPVQSMYDSDAGYGEPSTSQEMDSYSTYRSTDLLSVRRTPSPVEVLEEDGEFCVPVIVEHYIGDNMSSEPVPPKQLRRKRHSMESLYDSHKKRKVSAADSITYAAETQREILEKELQLKKEEHTMLMEIRKETLELLKIKKEVALEKLKFWKSKNTN